MEWNPSSAPLAGQVAADLVSNLAHLHKVHLVEHRGPSPPHASRQPRTRPSTRHQHFALPLLHNTHHGGLSSVAWPGFDRIKLVLQNKRSPHAHSQFQGKNNSNKNLTFLLGGTKPQIIRVLGPYSQYTALNKSNATVNTEA